MEFWQVQKIRDPNFRPAITGLMAKSGKIMLRRLKPPLKERLSRWKEVAGDYPSDIYKILTERFWSTTMRARIGSP